MSADFSVDMSAIPLVAGKIHFIRMVDGNGNISVLNEIFTIGQAYVGEYVWATISTAEQILTIIYNDSDMNIQNIKQFEYKISEKVHDVLSQK